MRLVLAEDVALVGGGWLGRDGNVVEWISMGVTGPMGLRLEVELVVSMGLGRFLDAGPIWGIAGGIVAANCAAPAPEAPDCCAGATWQVSRSAWRASLTARG